MPAWAVRKSRSSPLNRRELDAQARSRLYAQLAQTQRAGLPLNAAIDLLRDASPASLRSRLDQMRQHVGAGENLTRAGERSGVFLEWEARLLSAAEITGSLAQSYSALSRRHADRARRVSQIRRGMALPAVILVLAVFVAPLPALYLGEISGTTYLLSTLGRLGLLLAGLYLLSHAWTRLGASGADNAVFRLLLRLPVIGGLVRRQQQRDFLHSLALLLAAGVPALDALAVAADSISHPTLRGEFGLAIDRVRAGSTVCEALTSSGALTDGDAAGLIRSGEYAGRLADMLEHHVRQLDEQLDLHYAMLAEWAPRIAYLLIIAYFVLAR